MTEQEHAARIALQALVNAQGIDASGAMIAAAAYVEQYGAGFPDVPLVSEQVRRDASLWADCAAPHELEAYTVAAVGALADSPLLDKQLRKLAALAYGRMSPETKQKFKDWIDQQ